MSTIKADYDDLILERWFREREREQIVWITRSGEKIPINKMSDTHLDNTIKYLESKMEDVERTSDPDIF